MASLARVFLGVEIQPGAVIVIGGGVAEAGDVFLAAIRQSVYRRSLPLATRDLRIARSPLSNLAGLSGAAAVVIDELFKPDRAAQWIPRRTPHGDPALASQTGADSGVSLSAGALA